jgi:hypothetical protein
MRRLPVILLVLALTTACNLAEAPTPVPTSPPPPVLSNPFLSLSPVSGPPGTVIRVAAAGFPAGAQVNVTIGVSQPGQAAPAAPNPVMQGLTIGAGGILTFDYQLPTQINNTTLTGTTALTFTMLTVDNLPMQASAVFIATAGATATPSSGTTGTGGTGQLYIISPAISAVISGTSVVVTGSGSALNSRVGVQVQDARNNILGSALAIIQAGVGAIGPWETVVTFAQPVSPSGGYIVAYTVNAQGAVADMTSIPITFAGAGVPTATVAPTTVVTRAPTVPPVITVPPPTLAVPFITATSQQ